MLSQDSFDKSVSILATNTYDVIVEMYDALSERLGNAEEDFSSKNASVIRDVRSMKRQLNVLKSKRNYIDNEEIPYYAFQLDMIRTELEESVSRALLVEKIRKARKQIEDIDTKMKWMNNRIRKSAKSPALVRKFIQELLEERLVIWNALQIANYLSRNELRFGDLRESDLDRIYYKLRGEGEL